MSPGDIFLAHFPFGGATAGMKLRPVLLLTEPLGPVPEILVAYISSVVPAVPLPTDIILDPHQPEHQSTRLKVTSVIRLHKLASLHSSNLVRRLGMIATSTRTDVDAKLRAMLHL